MTLPDLLRLVRRSWLVIVVAVTVSAALAAVGALVTPPVYRSSVQLYVSVQTSAPDVSELAQGSSAAQQRVNSYVQVIRSASVLQPVIDELHLDETVAELADQVQATASVDSVLLDFSVDNTDRVRAQRIATAVTTSFREQVTDRLERPTTGGPSLVRIETVQPASSPEAPVSPSLVRNTLVGIVIGIALGVVVAVLRQLLDSKIRDQADVELASDSPVLGSIGFDPQAQQRPLIVQAEPHHRRSEAFRALRTSVQFVAMDGHRRSLTITSAVPSEGKSTTAANLAIAMAENGARVALVDADLRRPRVGELMGLESNAGMTDVLIGRVELEDVVMPWGRGGLHVLPSGQVPPNPSELLDSAAMLALMDALTSRYDLVILDAPPLLPVTDAAILARITDGAIVVAAVGKTTVKQLRAAVDTLRGVGSRSLGIVMTMVRTKNRSAYDTYYHQDPAAQRPRTVEGALRSASDQP